MGCYHSTIGRNVRPLVTDTGEIGFVQQLTAVARPPLTTITSFLYGKPGELQVIAAKGLAAPGTDTTYNVINGRALNTKGGFGYLAALTSGGTGVFAGTNANDVTLVARTQNQVPGLANGIAFGSIGVTSRLVAAPGGSVMLAVPLAAQSGNPSAPVIDATNNQALFYRSSTGSTAIVARTGDAAPGYSAGIKYSAFDSYSFAGDNVVYRSTVTGGGTTTNNDSGVWYGPIGSQQLPLREGDTAPGHIFADVLDPTVTPVTYNTRISTNSPFNGVVANANGVIAYEADLFSLGFGGTGNTANRSTGLFVTAASRNEMTRC